MKGTLFAADFIKSSNKKLKLTDIQTDTGFYTEALNDLDLTEWIEVIKTNHIFRVHIVFKEAYHRNIVDKIVEALEQANIEDLDIKLHPEKIDALKARTVPDTKSKFILRIAYDERAVLDKKYARKRINLYNLFVSNGKQDLIPEYYYSDDNTTVNTITPVKPNDNLPDVLQKQSDKLFNKLNKFWNINSTGDDYEKVWENFIEKKYKEGTILEKVDIDQTSFEDNKFTKYRQYGIVYGNELKFIPILQHKITAPLELPESLNNHSEKKSVYNTLPKKLYYSYSPEFIKTDQNAILSDHEILMYNNSYSELKQVQLDDEIVVDEDSNIGTVVVDSKFGVAMDTVLAISVEGYKLYLGTGTFIKVNNGNEDIHKFAINLEPGIDSIRTGTGDLIKIDKVEFVVLDDSESKLNYIKTEVGDSVIVNDNKQGIAVSIDYLDKPYIF